ncbi:MAG: GNAT family N-acetyltransferase [Actinobacteria bacterium]|nr:MAG: GNAT family N-acetyltransferase [Actinomycetota bacterium]
MLQTRRLLVGDEQALREIRLRSLRGEPSAYGSSYKRENAFVEVDWRQRVVGIDSATFVCKQDNADAIGLVSGVLDESQASVAWLVAMWVDPEFRRKGVAGLLINEVIAWSAMQSCTTIRLFVTEGNVTADRSYEKYGFRKTGATELRDRDNKIENEMEMILDSKIK